MSTNIPERFQDMVAPMQVSHQEIERLLTKKGLAIESYPNLDSMGQSTGVAAAKAYPIQGILKYHGMSDWQWRISHLPSISLNNDAAHTITRVEFDPNLSEDQAIIGNTPAQGRELERVQQILHVVRNLAGISTPARVTSQNFVRASQTGKGLGTSASASAALALATIAATFGPKIAQNRRLVSCIARLLAGSGGRSAAGGVSLWLSYPGIGHEDSYSIRLDQKNELADVRLITIPLNSRIGLKTEVAHEDAPNSPFFKTWMMNRQAEIVECVNAIQASDWETVGQLAELDSIQLHGVTMSGSRSNKIFAWEPENIRLFRMCNELRSDGIPVYFSTDTGPTVVLITHKDYLAAVTAKIHSLNSQFEVVQGEIAGPAQLLDLDEAKTELGL